MREHIMEKTAKSNQGYIAAALLAAALLAAVMSCIALTTAAYAQQQNEPIPLHSHGTDTADGYTQEDLPVPEPQLDEPQAIDQTLESPAGYSLPPEAQAEAQAMAEIIDSYKRCIRDIIASDSPTAVKREEIDTQCWAERQQIADNLPQDLQEFMLLNMDRRTDLVLRTMSEAEGVVDTSMEDIAEAVSAFSVEGDQEDSQ